VGNEAIRNAPAFRFARLLSCRRLATASNEAPGRWQPPPHPRYPLRFAWLASGLLPRATKRLVGGSRPHTPASRCFRLVLQAARFRVKRNFTQVGATAHTPPLSALLGFCLAGSSLPRATKRLAGGSRPYSPASRFARLGLQAARYREQRSASQMGAAAPTPLLSALLGLSCRRLATAGNEIFRRWGLPPLTPPLPAAFGWSCRRLATAANETFRR
jgi:hypothetical protein